MAPKSVRNAPCQECVVEGEAVDLADWPIQTCWPEDVAPLITWGLTTTRGPLHERQNLGIYRQQVLGRNKIIMRWLAHRGGATDYQAFREQRPGERFPVAVSLGAVFFGAMTYIGNGPNFMVKSIADSTGVHTPAFFGYILKFSLPVLFPILLLGGWLFL